MNAPPGRVPILVLATEWEPEHGGLSVFNQKLCRALARRNDVVCYVPANGSAVAWEVAPNLTVVPAPPTPGIPARHPSQLLRKPPIGIEPAVIIGHDDVTGPYALALKEDRFPSATLALIIHTSQRELEPYKAPGLADRSEPTGARIQEALIRSADVVLAVGPRLFHQTAQVAHSLDLPAPIRLDPGMDQDAVAVSGRPPPEEEVLVICRTKHPRQKGLDRACAAVGALYRGGRKVALTVLGAAPGEEVSLRETLLTWSDAAGMSLVVEPFDPQPDAVMRCLRRASVILVPSREEGFGLSGLEAIEACVPVLVGGNSGLAELLTSDRTTALSARVIDEREPEYRWTERIGQVLDNAGPEFAMARQIQGILKSQLNWDTTAATFEKAVLGSAPEPVTNTDHETEVAGPVDPA